MRHISLAVLDSIGNIATRTYLLLGREADEQGVVRRTSRGRVARQLDCHPATIANIFRELEEIGAIRVERDPHSSSSFNVHLGLPASDGGKVPLVRTGQGDYARDHYAEMNDAECE